MHKIRFNFSEALDYRTVKGFPASIILAAQSRRAYNLLYFVIPCFGSLFWDATCSGLRAKREGVKF